MMLLRLSVRDLQNEGGKSGVPTNSYLQTGNEKSMGRLAELAGDQTLGEKSRTFVFMDEGHTLGNALRYIISQYPDIQFCGYTVPHPSEAKMYFRIQAKHGQAVDILKRGLEDLEKICDHTLETFNESYEQFKSEKGLPMDRC